MLVGNSGLGARSLRTNPKLTDPPHRPVAAALSLRSVGPEDQNFLLSLFESAREKELAWVDWKADRRRIFIETQFRAQQKHYQKHFPNRDHHIVMLDGKPAGMTDIARNAEEIRVLDIIILPEHRNAGIGTALMRKLITEADHLGKTLRLYVEKFNPACGLYTRLGFSVAEDAGVHYLMERRPESDPKASANPKIAGGSHE